MHSLLLLDSNTNDARASYLTLLREIDIKSFDKIYNCKLYWDVFERNMRIAFAMNNSELFHLYPQKVHKHKGGIKFEPRRICELDVSPYFSTFLTIDIPLKMYDSLMTLKFVRNSIIKEFCE